jgi:transcriptional regulator of aromatic amino acid metabolism
MAIADLIGSSARFQAVLDDVRVVAGADCSVLVQGETGTGKEVIVQPPAKRTFCGSQLRRDSCRLTGKRTLRS